MKSLRLFRDACQKYPQSKEAWGVLFNAALEYCKTTAQPSVDRSLGRGVPSATETQITTAYTKYLEAKSSLEKIVGSMGIKVPKFSANDICELAD